MGRMLARCIAGANCSSRCRLPRWLPASNAAPERAETGTLNHEGMAGAAAAVDFLASLAPRETRRESLAVALEAIHQRSLPLFQQLWTGLAEIDGVTLYGPPPAAARTSTVAFTVRGVSSREVAGRLAERAVFVSSGNFYAMTVVERLGLVPKDSSAAGSACYTTADEVTRLIDGVRAIAAQRQPSIHELFWHSSLLDAKQSTADTSFLIREAASPETVDHFSAFAGLTFSTGTIPFRSVHNVPGPE